MEGKWMKDRRALFLVWLGLLVMSVVFVVPRSKQTQQVETIPYSQFQELLRQGHIEQVVVGADDLHGSLTADELPKPQVELTGGSWRGQGSAGRQALPRVMP
jgi:hypothetical protein